MSAISPSSASVRAVQSFVSTTIDMAWRVLPSSRPLGCESIGYWLPQPPVRPSGASSASPAPPIRHAYPRDGALLGQQTVRAEEDPHLGGEAVRGVDAEVVGELEHRLADVEEHAARSGVGPQQRLQLLEPALRERVGGDRHVYVGGRAVRQIGPRDLDRSELRLLVPG